MGIRGSSLVFKFILTLFLARFLSFESLGIYGLIGAACNVAPTLVGFSLMYTISRKAVTLTQAEIYEQLSYYIQITLLIYMFALPFVATFGYMEDQIFIYLLILCVVLLEHLNMDIYSLLLNLSRPLFGNILHFFRTSIWMMSYMTCAYIYPEYRELKPLLFFWFVGNTIPLVIFYLSLLSWDKHKSNIKTSTMSWFKHEYMQSKTAHKTNCLRSFSQYVNHIYITFLLGIELTGVYVFFMQVISAMSNLLQTGVIQIARPKLIQAFSDFNQQEYWKIYRRCMANSLISATLMAMFAIPCMVFLIHYVVLKPLAVEWLHIFWCLLGLFVLGTISMVNSIVFYSQYRDDELLKIFIIGFLPSLIVTPLLIYIFNLNGVVAATLVFSSLGIFLQFWKFKNLKMRVFR